MVRLPWSLSPPRTPRTRSQSDSPLGVLGVLCGERLFFFNSAHLSGSDIVSIIRVMPARVYYPLEVITPAPSRWRGACAPARVTPIWTACALVAGRLYIASVLRGQRVGKILEVAGDRRLRDDEFARAAGVSREDVQHEVALRVLERALLD